jgi:hypothetical protein
LLAHVYFDWEGSQDELVEYAKKLESACKKTKTKFMGVWSPHQETWHYVAMIEANTMDEALQSFREAGGKIKSMPRGMLKYYFRTYP